MVVDQYLLTVYPKSVFKVLSRDYNNFYCYINYETIHNFCFFVKQHYNIRANVSIDITAADYLEYKQRFQVFYNVYSVLYNYRLLLIVSICRDTNMPSITNIFLCANWLEREVWDMFGIVFVGHTDLRRILTDYGYMWHPLRKDFPLSGYIEIHYDEQYKCIMHNDINLIQEYRH